MNTDGTLNEAFAALEGLAPDPDVEFAALTARIDRLGRRRTYRFAMSGVAATGLVAAAITAGVANTSSDHDRSQGLGGSTSRSGHSSSAPRPTVRQVAFDSRLTTMTGADGIARPLVTVGAGWLPRGARLEQVGADSSADMQSFRSWTIPNQRGGGRYQIDLTAERAQRFPDRVLLFGRGTGLVAGRDITVQGNPARIYRSATGFMVRIFVKVAPDRLIEADTFRDLGQMSVAQASVITRHVARTMTYDQHETLRVTARLTAAPARARIVSAYATVARDFRMTYYQLNSQTRGAQIGIGGIPVKYPVPAHGRTGRSVQGRPSVVAHSGGHVVLYVKGLFGRYTELISGAGAETLEDLYLIADGIRDVR